MFKSKLLNFLLFAYAIECIALAFHPVDRTDWFAENLTVWLIVGTMVILAWRGVVFSNLAYALMFVLVFLHTIGGHYTFALVPFDFVTNTFGFHRNHFDRVAHFSVGFYAFAIAEWLDTRKLVNRRFILFTYPIAIIGCIAALYEILEWIYAVSSDPNAGDAFLGSQGDIWDAQEDMLSDILGAITATVFYFVVRKPSTSRMGFND